MPKAMARSKLLPSFFMPAGARFTVILSGGKRNPLFFIADFILSLLSFTLASGRPTILVTGRPEVISTSISIG